MANELDVPTSDETLKYRSVYAWTGRTAEELRDLLESNSDPETGHIVIDELWRTVLTAIRDGHPNPVGLARAALIVDDADIDRWYS